MIVTYEEAAAAIKGTADPQDPDFRMVVDAADRFVKNYCNRNFEFATYTEFVAGLGTNSVFLKEMPVGLVDALDYDYTGAFTGEETSIATDAFHVEDNRLVWHEGAFDNGSEVVRITYSGGYGASPPEAPSDPPQMPADLKRAVIKIIASEYRNSNSTVGTGEKFKSESIGAYSYTRFENDNTNSFPYDPAVESVLDSYRRWW